MDLLSEQKKEIRVFISSTFSDLDNERNYLVKNIFPQIRQRCKNRGHEFIELDLRWGITEEEAKQGKVIDICLKEIDRCYPFFIGIIGGRYGWIPNKVEIDKIKDKVDNYSWLNEKVNEGLSITEIEIKHRLLKNEDLNESCLFFLKRIESVNSMNLDLPNSIQFQKLNKLKEILYNTKGIQIFEYSKENELGDYVVNQLWNHITKQFPELLIENSPVSINSEDPGAFSKTRRKLYIGGEQYYHLLNQHYKSNEAPLVITGEVGIGKSALLANWAEQFKKNNPGTLIHIHHVEAGYQNTEPKTIISNIIEKLKGEFDGKHIESVINNGDNSIITKALKQTENKGDWILIIDGIDYVNEPINKNPLTWLPEEFPPWVKIYLSCENIKLIELLEQRGCRIIKIEPLNPMQRRELIIKHLKQFGKTLPDHLIDIITTYKESSNPLLLITLLEEIRFSGEYNKLESLIIYYTKNINPTDFFDAVLNRWKLDYEKEKVGLVDDVLKFLYCSKFGLSEIEILELTGIPTVYWLMFYSAVEHHFINANGLFTFSHDYLRKAVERRYYSNKDNVKPIHVKLSNYFKKSKDDVRGLQELSYHYRNSDQFENLSELMQDIEYLTRLFWHDEVETSKIFLCIKDKISDIKCFFNNIFDSLQSKYENEINFNYSTNFLKLCKVINEAGLHTISIGKFNEIQNNKKLFEIFQNNNKNILLIFYQDLGIYYSNIGNYNEAILIYEKALNLQITNSLETEYINNIFESLIKDKLAFCYCAIGNYQKALHLIEEAISLQIKIFKNSSNLNHYYNQMGDILYQKGDYDKAEDILKTVIKNYTVNFYPNAIWGALITLGKICNKKNDFENAHIYYNKALKILESKTQKDWADWINIGSILNNTGLLFFRENKFNEAILCYENALKKIEDRSNIQQPLYHQILSNYASALIKLNKYEEGLNYLNQFIEEYEKFNFKNADDLVDCINLLTKVNNEFPAGKNIEQLYLKVLDQNNQSDIKLQGYNHAEVLFRLGDINYKQNKFSKSKQFYEEFLIIWGNGLIKAREIRLAKGEKDNTDSVILMDNLYISEPEERLGIIYYIEKDYKKAVFHINKAIEHNQIIQNLLKLSPNDNYFRLRYYLGLIYYKQKDLIKTLNIYKEAITLMRNNENEEVREWQLNILLKLADILFNEKMNNEAKLYYTKAILFSDEIVKNNKTLSLVNIFHRLSIICYYENDYLNSEIWIQKAIKFDNENLNHHNSLININNFKLYNLLGYIQESKREFKKAFDIYNKILKYMKCFDDFDKKEIFEIEASIKRVKNELPLIYTILK